MVKKGTVLDGRVFGNTIDPPDVSSAGVVYEDLFGTVKDVGSRKHFLDPELKVHVEGI